MANLPPGAEEPGPARVRLPRAAVLLYLLAGVVLARALVSLGAAVAEEGRLSWDGSPGAPLVLLFHSWVLSLVLSGALLSHARVSRRARRCGLALDSAWVGLLGSVLVAELVHVWRLRSEAALTGDPAAYEPSFGGVWTFLLFLAPFALLLLFTFWARRR